MIWLVNSFSPLADEVISLLKKNGLPFTQSGTELNTENAQDLENYFKSTETQNYFSSHKNNDDGKIKWVIFLPEQNQNAKKTLNIARLCRNHNAKLIFISSPEVFSGNENLYTEKSEKNAQTEEGKLKIEQEESITSSMTQYYIIRPSFLYGNQNDILKDFIFQCKTNGEFSLSQDLKINPVSFQDVAEIILKIIFKSENAKSFFGKNSAPSFGIYNFSSEDGTTLFEFLNESQKLLEKSQKIESNAKIIPSEKVLKSFLLDSSKIKNELKIKLPHWKDSLKKYILLHF